MATASRHDPDTFLTQLFIPVPDLASLGASSGWRAWSSSNSREGSGGLAADMTMPIRAEMEKILVGILLVMEGVTAEIDRWRYGLSGNICREKRRAL